MRMSDCSGGLVSCCRIGSKAQGRRFQRWLDCNSPFCFPLPLFLRGSSLFLFHHPSRVGSSSGPLAATGLPGWPRTSRLRTSWAAPGNIPVQGGLFHVRLKRGHGFIGGHPGRTSHVSHPAHPARSAPSLSRPCYTTMQHTLPCPSNSMVQKQLAQGCSDLRRPHAAELGYHPHTYE